MADKENINLWYDENQALYDAFATKVSSLLEELLIEEKIPFHSISHRVKEKQKYIEKVYRKNYKNPSEEIMDFAGIRIIAYTSSDVQKICDIINNEFLINEEHSGNKADLLNSDKVGYQSVHFIASLSSTRTELREYSRFKDLVCEIQVRTLLQHAWAEIEHDRSYKFSGVLPKDISRRFHLIAGVLEMMDREFQRLSDEIDEYVNKVREETERGNLDLPIDTTSLAEYISRKIKSHNIEKTFNGLDKRIVEELEKFGIEKISQLDPLFSDSFCNSIDSHYNNSSGQNYAGLLRDAMICYNAEHYFKTAWNGSWTFCEADTYNFWKSFGVDTSLIKKHVQVVRFPT